MYSGQPSVATGYYNSLFSGTTSVTAAGFELSPLTRGGCCNRLSGGPPSVATGYCNRLFGGTTSVTAAGFELSPLTRGVLRPPIRRPTQCCHWLYHTPICGHNQRCSCWRRAIPANAGWVLQPPI